MKSQSFRGVAALVLAAFLSVSIAPIAAAAWREDRDGETKIVRFVKTLQRLLRLIPNDDSPNPPKP